MQNIHPQPINTQLRGKDSIPEVERHEGHVYPQQESPPTQRTQVEEWLLQQCDAILIDGTLLEWQWQRLREQSPRVFGDTDRDVVYVPLPQGHELWWHVGFRSRELRDRFDVALAQIQADGTYRRIRQRYGLQ